MFKQNEQQEIRDSFADFLLWKRSCTPPGWAAVLKFLPTMVNAT